MKGLKELKQVVRNSLKDPKFAAGYLIVAHEDYIDTKDQGRSGSLVLLTRETVEVARVWARRIPAVKEAFNKYKSYDHISETTVLELWKTTLNELELVIDISTFK